MTRRILLCGLIVASFTQWALQAQESDSLLLNPSDMRLEGQLVDDLLGGDSLTERDPLEGLGPADDPALPAPRPANPDVDPHEALWTETATRRPSPVARATRGSTNNGGPAVMLMLPSRRCSIDLNRQPSI